jgi:hypothetical protein
MTVKSASEPDNLVRRRKAALRCQLVDKPGQDLREGFWLDIEHLEYDRSDHWLYRGALGLSRPSGPAVAGGFFFSFLAFSH